MSKDLNSLEGKYGFNSVYDFKIYKDGELVHTINSVNESDFEMNLNSEISKLKIKDALVDVELTNKIFSGDFTDCFVSIVGETIFRNADTYEDVTSMLIIDSARLISYSMVADSYGATKPEYLFKVYDAKLEVAE